MSIDPVRQLICIPNNSIYKRFLSPKLYWSGMTAIILQTIGTVGIFVKHSLHTFLLPLSIVEVFLCFLIVGMQENDTNLHDNWRLRVYMWVLGLFVVQVLLTLYF